MEYDENGKPKPEPAAAPPVKEEEKQEGVMNNNMDYEDQGNGNNDMYAQMMAKLDEMISLLRGTEGIAEKSKQLVEEGKVGGGAEAVESPNPDDIATPEGGEAAGEPLPDVDSTVTTEGELSKDILAIAKDSLRKDQELERMRTEMAEMKKTLEGLNNGNTTAVRGGQQPPAPPVGPPDQQLPGMENLDDVQKSIFHRLANGEHVSSKEIMDARPTPQGV